METFNRKYIYTNFKEHTDILKIKLVTTVGYVKDDNNNWIPRFMKGFPLLLQGDMNSITNGNWEKDWNFFANTAFSTFMSGLPSTGEQPTGEPIPELMYKNMKEKKNLLILDLNTDRNDNGITQTHNFILHFRGEIGIYFRNASGWTKIYYEFTYASC